MSPNHCLFAAGFGPPLVQHSHRNWPSSTPPFGRAICSNQEQSMGGGSKVILHVYLNLCARLRLKRPATLESFPHHCHEDFCSIKGICPQIRIVCVQERGGNKYLVLQKTPSAIDQRPCQSTAHRIGIFLSDPFKSEGGGLFITIAAPPSFLSLLSQKQQLPSSDWHQRPEEQQQQRFRCVGGAR